MCCSVSQCVAMCCSALQSVSENPLFLPIPWCVAKCFIEISLCNTLLCVAKRFREISLPSVQTQVLHKTMSVLVCAFACVRVCVCVPSPCPLADYAPPPLHYAQTYGYSVHARSCVRVNSRACCSVLQRFAVCCSVLQCVAARTSVLQYYGYSTHTR